jgi:hypothetical protein
LKINHITTIAKNRNLIFFLVCLFLALINLSFKLSITPAWFNGILNRNHALLLGFNYTNNEQSRLLQFYIPEFFIRLFGLSVINAYILQRFLLTFLTFFLFFLFAKKWFKNNLAITCVVVMAIIMPFSYQNHLQESAPLMSFTFLCAIWAIRENKTGLYVMILLIGSINNETMLFVPTIYFFVNYQQSDKYDFIRLGIKTVLLALPALAVVGAIRYINIDRPHLGGGWHFYENMDNLYALFMVFNIFWILSFLKFKKKPLFLQRSLLTIPLFIIPHMITGIITETRQMLPLSFILIPSSIFYLIELNKTRINKKCKMLDSFRI